MYKLNKIDKKCYYKIITEFDNHIANGNIGPFEIHLDNTDGSPVMSYYILKKAMQKGIDLKTYCSGKILNGGVAIILGCRHNVCYSCTSLYVKKPKKKMDYYFGNNWYGRHIYGSLLRISEYDELNVNEPISGGELFTFGLFHEYRHEFRRQIHSPWGIINSNMKPQKYNGHICSCKTCKGVFYPAEFLELQLCTCGRHSPTNGMCDCGFIQDPYAVIKGVIARDKSKDTAYSSVRG